MRTDKYNKANSHVLQFRELVKKGLTVKKQRLMLVILFTLSNYD
jgi:hypothetical protein